MSDTRRGFGVAGALDHEIVRPLATRVQELGYATFWANDTPTGDGLAALAVAASVASDIRLGVGVIAVDRIPAERIAARVDELALPRDRLLVGIGSGRTRVGSLELVRDALRVLRAHGIRTAVGALGPRMVALSGEEADAVLLNWLTPRAAVDSTAAFRAAAGERRVESIAYVRVGFGAGAHDRLESEALRYEAVPQYGAHFDRMGVRAIETAVEGSSAVEIDAGLRAFNGPLDEVVVRAITGDEELDSYLSLAEAAAPVIR